MWRVIVSPVLVVLTILLIPSVSEALLYLPLIIALAVSLPNLRHFKPRLKWFGPLLTVIQSYAVFIGLGLITYFSDEFLPDFSLANHEEFGLKGIILVTLGGYLAAMLLFYFYSFVFRVERRRFSYLLITISYFFIILVMQVFSQFEFLQFGVEKFASFLVSWVIFMSFAYSLSLNRSSFLTFFGWQKD